MCFLAIMYILEQSLKKLCFQRASSRSGKVHSTSERVSKHFWRYYHFFFCFHLTLIYFLIIQRKDNELQTNLNQWKRTLRCLFKTKACAVGIRNAKQSYHLTTLPNRPRQPRNFFAVFRVTFLMARVCFKPITWYIEMHHVRTIFFCVVLRLFRITLCPFTTCLFKKKVYRAFCLP